MNIGFDAKRAFHNQTGLGHYSRTLIQSLAKYYPDNEYFLFNPKASSLFDLSEENVYEVRPNGFPSSLFRSAWRSSWIKKDLKKFHIELYHGLSHEIPFGIRETKIKSVVTIHDLIYERYPGQYNPVDVRIYRKKFRYACEQSHRIIAISEQTKKDIIEYFSIPPSKIEVCYQSCNPAFAEKQSDELKEGVREKYNLPQEYFLHVASIIERKNLLTICKALFILRDQIKTPLVVIGDGGKYKEQVKNFLLQNGLTERVIFLSETEKEDPDFATAKIFPAIYQQARAMIYPSLFEGFGIPVLEALFSGIPVITSNISSLPEAGGEGAYYVNPLNAEEIAEAMRKIYFNPEQALLMVEKGGLHAQKFTIEKTAAAVMRVYRSVVPD